MAQKAAKLTMVIKVCHLRRAMNPEKFPTAFDSVLAKLKRVGAGESFVLQKCRCKPECDMPPRTGIALFVAKVGHEGMDWYARLFRKPAR